MRLYLAQHGLAVSKQDDPQRPLSEAGVNDIEHVTALLGDAGVQVARAWHSGKLRAGQTATILARRVLPKGKPEQVDGIAPNDPVEEFVTDIDVWQEDTLVVGHLPFMSRLVALLLNGDAERESVSFTPGTIACLERGKADQWTLLWLLRPELLGSESQS
jgi:phosphohistidine phosphatase